MMRPLSYPPACHLFGCAWVYRAVIRGTKEMMRPLSYPPACHLFGCAWVYRAVIRGTKEMMRPLSYPPACHLFGTAQLAAATADQLPTRTAAAAGHPEVRAHNPTIKIRTSEPLFGFLLLLATASTATARPPSQHNPTTHRCPRTAHLPPQPPLHSSLTRLPRRRQAAAMEGSFCEDSGRLRLFLPTGQAVEPEAVLLTPPLRLY